MAFAFMYNFASTDPKGFTAYGNESIEDENIDPTNDDEYEDFAKNFDENMERCKSDKNVANWIRDDGKIFNMETVCERLTK